MKNIIFATLLFFSSPLIAQNPEWIYLSKVESIQTITEDENSIWIGSHAGVLKIDKITGARVFFDKTNSPFIDSWIRRIVVDNEGNKWFGSYDKGILVKYDNTNWTVYDTSNSPLSGNAIYNLVVDSNNFIWLTCGNINGPLMKFDGTNWTLYNTSNSGLPSNFIENIFSEGGNIWLSCNGILVKFDGTNWTEYNTSNSAISGKSINQIDKDENENIWLLHYDGVEKFDGNTFTVFDETNTNIPNIRNYSMTIDTNNIIWTGCGSYNYSPHILGGLMSFNGNSWTKYDSTNSPINSESAGPVYADHFNNIWFGCGQNGMFGRKSGSTWSSYDASNSELGNRTVRQIVSATDGNTYIGTQEPYTSGSALVKYDLNNWEALPNYDDQAHFMATDQSNNLYIKQFTGLMKYDGAIWSSIPNTPLLQAACYLELKAFATDISGGIWMDYVDRVEEYWDPISHTHYYIPHEGMAHYDGTTWTTFNNLNSPLPDAFINQIVIDEYNIVWVSTETGLFKYDGTNWTVFNTSNSLLPFNNIKSFVFDFEGNIWFSNGRYGFYKFEWTNLVNYTHPYLNIYQSGGTLAIDIDGSIWQYTLFELIKFDGTNWATFDYKNSPIPNSTNLNCLSIDKFGNKWLGTQFGVLVYNQSGIINSINPLPNHNISPSIYPNPFTEEIEIDLITQYNKVVVTLFDLQSRPVYTACLSQAQKIKVPRNNLKSGIYFYQIVSDNCIISNGKIIAK
jgi:ligand-binding sensor domain-containing protein